MLVRIHNDYRRRVAKGRENRGSAGPQPPAQDMFELVWDDELARVAQRYTVSLPHTLPSARMYVNYAFLSFRWADQCPEYHDKNRVIAGFDKYPYVGQNIADTWNYIYLSDRGYEQKVTAWYDEVCKAKNIAISLQGISICIYWCVCVGETLSWRRFSCLQFQWLQPSHWTLHSNGVG